MILVITKWPPSGKLRLFINMISAIESTPGPRLQPDTFEPLTRASVLAHLRATGGAAVLRRDQVAQVAQVDGQTSERAPQSVSARG